MTPQTIDSRLHLDDIGAPPAVLVRSSCVRDASPSAAALSARMQLALEDSAAGWVMAAVLPVARPEQASG